MGKVRFYKLRKFDDEYYCDCRLIEGISPCTINHSGDYYPSADYEALEAKLAALVKAANKLIKFFDEESDAPLVINDSLDEFKAAIAAAEDRKGGEG